MSDTAVNQKPGELTRLLTSVVNSQRKRLLVILLVLAPAIIWGSIYRWREFTRTAPVETPADAVGFVALAEAEPYKYFNGWREPLWPLLLKVGLETTGVDALQLSFVINLICSILVIPALFLITWKMAGLIEGIIAAYIIALSSGHFRILSFAAREDLVLLCLLGLLALYSTRKFGWAFLLTGILVHLRVSVLVFSVLFYSAFVTYTYFMNGRGNVFAFLRKLHNPSDKWFLLAGIVITAPLLLYYYHHFGDPMIPQSLAVHEYFYREKYGKWMTSVENNFSQIALPDSSLVTEMLFADNANLLLKAAEKLIIADIMVWYIAGGAITFSAFLLGMVLCALKRKTFPLLIFFGINTAPLIAISWSEQFRPGLALVPGAMAIVFIGVTLGAIARLLLRVERLSQIPQNSFD